MGQQQSLQQQYCSSFKSFNWTQSVLSTSYQDILKSDRHRLNSDKDKDINFTISQISKSQFPFIQVQRQEFNLEQFNHKVNRRNKNKMNSKNFRQRKKHQQHLIDKQFKMLKEENIQLKREKYCRYCQMPYQKLIEYNQLQAEEYNQLQGEELQQKKKYHRQHQSNQFDKQHQLNQFNKQHHFNQFINSHQQVKQLQFMELDSNLNPHNQQIYPHKQQAIQTKSNLRNYTFNENKKNIKNKNQKQNHNFIQIQKNNQDLQFQPFNQFKQNNNQKTGKIWIALAILMLVLGVHLYGFHGEQPHQGISFSKIQSKKWISIFDDKSSSNEHFNVKMKVKENQSYSKDKKHSIQQQQGIFRQIKIFHEKQSTKSYHSKSNEKNKQSHHQHQNYKYSIESKSKSNSMIDESTQNSNRRFTQINFDLLQNDANEEVNFHKEFILAIQAEIDEIGRYV